MRVADTGADWRADRRVRSDGGPDYAICEHRPEICDGRDNDCDGIIDEGLLGGTERCEVLNGEICTEGVVACVAGVEVCRDLGIPCSEPEPPPQTPDSGCAEHGHDGLGPHCVEGPWGPAGRLVDLSVPSNPETARLQGCDLVGSSAGTTIRPLVDLLTPGGLNSLTQPDSSGQIYLIVYGHFIDWLPGRSIQAVSALDLGFYVGVHIGPPPPNGEWLIDPDSLVDEPGGRAQSPRVLFRGTRIEPDGRVTGSTDPFVMLVPGAVPVPLRLRVSRLSGHIEIDWMGFRLRQGVMTGYLTVEGLIEIIRGIQHACAAPNPPSVCDIVAAVVGGVDQDPEFALSMLLPLLGGYDARVTDGTASRCDVGMIDDCNAIGVCLQFEMEPINIIGVAN